MSMHTKPNIGAGGAGGVWINVTSGFDRVNHFGRRNTPDFRRFWRSSSLLPTTQQSTRQPTLSQIKPDAHLDCTSEPNWIVSWINTLKCCYPYKHKNQTIGSLNSWSENTQHKEESSQRVKKQKINVVMSNQTCARTTNWWVDPKLAQECSQESEVFVLKFSENWKGRQRLFRRCSLFGPHWGNTN